MHYSMLLSALVALPMVLAAPLETNALLPRQAGQIYTKCNRPGVIALTFDDGPGQYMDQLINTLNSNNVKATFFVTGTLYGCIHNRASTVKKAYNAGHQIASHTWSHPQLGNLGADQIRTEMTRLEGALATIIGKKPTYMRPPYLNTGGQTLSVLGQLGYRAVTCDIDTEDWNNVTPANSLQKFRNAGASGNGHIALMHETVQSTASQLAQMVIDWAKQNNLTPVTVAECIGAGEAYTTAGAGTSGC